MVFRQILDKMKSIFLQAKSATLYTVIWCLYFLQGFIYADGSAIAKVLLILFVFYSIKYAVLVNIEFKINPFIKSINWLVMMFAIYGILRVVWGDDGSWAYQNDPTTYLKDYLISILPIYAFYYFARKGEINEDWFFYMAFVFLLVAVMQFYREQTVRLATAWRKEVTNNTGYVFLGLIPCVIFIKKKPIYQFAFLSIVLVFILQSMKRGAILVAAVSLFFLLPDMIRATKGKSRLIVILLSIAILIGGFYYVTAVMMKSEYFMMRVEQTLDGDASKREDMYPMYYHYFTTHYDSIQQIFGGGADSTLRYMGDFAHNDWLELLLNQGIFGVILYLAYWINGAKYFMSYRKNTPVEINTIIGLAFFVCFVKSFFSMSINGMPLYTTSALGYAIAKKDMILRSL